MKVGRLLGKWIQRYGVALFADADARHPWAAQIAKPQRLVQNTRAIEPKLKSALDQV